MLTACFKQWLPKLVAASVRILKTCSNLSPHRMESQDMEI